MSVAQEHTSIYLHRYGYEDGMSHRNVFGVAQTPDGLIWLATINALNRYDSYRFRHYAPSDLTGLPAPPYQAIAATPQGALWLGCGAQLTRVQPQGHRARSWPIPADEGEEWQIHEILPQGAHTCHVLARALPSGRLYWWRWHQGAWQEVGWQPAAESTAMSRWRGTILWLTPRGLLEGGQPPEPQALAVWLRPGEKNWPFAPDDPPVALFNQADQRLWALSQKGNVYVSTDGRQWQRHAASDHWPRARPATTLLVTRSGHVWIGGRQELMWYDPEHDAHQHFSGRFDQLFEYPPTFRQLMEDSGGVVWAATEFGALTATAARPFFRRYLHGGNERCTNGFCSIRGMTVDAAGKVYISYYHGIHVLDPASGLLAPLVPGRPFYHTPFGLLWAEDALWTGDGLRLHLPKGPVDTLLPRPLIGSEGVVARDGSGQIWMGCGHVLARMQPRAAKPTLLAHGLDTTAFRQITYLEPAAPDSLHMWVGTDGAGVFLVDPTGQVRDHIGTEQGLAHPRVLATLQLGDQLWIATAAGLHAYHLPTRRMQRWTQREGLPNDFINGLLPEGDSALWISTDLGLARMRLADHSLQRFFREDGLAQNEFNRIAFLRTPDGRMYFGGLNGVTAFTPGPQLARLLARPATPLLWSGLSWYDTRRDTLVQLDGPLPPDTTLHLHWRDKLLRFRFALADFSRPREHKYVWRLSGYADQWSEPVAVPEVLINELAGGHYTLEVRPQGPAMGGTLRIHLDVAGAWYRQPGWWLALIGIVLMASWALFRYRLQVARARARRLERMVEARTRELARAREQSEALLRNILPASIAEELKQHGRVAARRYSSVSVLFTDFSGFSRWASILPPEQLVSEIDRCFRAFDQIVEAHQLEKIKTIGDAYMCAAGLFDASGPGAARAIVEAAIAMQRFMEQYRRDQPEGAPAFEMRVGIHTGAVVAGVVGTRKFAFDIWGQTVNVAQRLEQRCPLNAIQVSAHTLEACGAHSFVASPNGHYTPPDGQPIPTFLIAWR